MKLATTSLRVVLGFLWAAMTLAAQTGAPGVEQYFVDSPFLRHGQGSGERSDHWLHLGLDGPFPPSDLDAAAKRDLLRGVSLAPEQPVQALVLDAKNGFLHLALEFDDLTLVYFERADKSRVVAVRLGDTSGQFWTQDWQFFEVGGGRWEFAEDLFPAGWLKAYLPKEPTATEADYLALTSWDIDLPHFGTSVHLTPQAYASDLEGPEVMLLVPATNREVNYLKYLAWFQKVFCDLKKNPKSLELKWNKSKGRFDAGKLAVWSPQP